MPHEQNLAKLARSFPSLSDAPLIPWDSEKFAAWAACNLSSGGLHAARFVLAVWNSHSAPAGRLRHQLLDEFDRVYMDAVYATVDRPHAEETLFDRVVSCYRDGDRKGAQAAAEQLAKNREPKCQRLARWLAEPRMIEEETMLQRVNEAEVWCIGRFDLMDALGTWDDAHRQACQAWMSKPWWC